MITLKHCHQVSGQINQEFLRNKTIKMRLLNRIYTFLKKVHVKINGPIINYFRPILFKKKLLKIIKKHNSIYNFSLNDVEIYVKERFQKLSQMEIQVTIL